MNNFLKFKQEIENKPNFKDHLRKDLLDKNKVISEFKIKDSFYNRLKEFFIYFNYDSIPKTFNEKIYSKYKLENLKIITRADLKTAFPIIFNKLDKEIHKANTKEFFFYTNFYKVLYFFNFDIPNNKLFDDKMSLSYPLDWNLFYKTFEEYININNPNNNEMETYLKDFSIIIEKKDLDFEYYQNLYKRTKRNIFYSALRDIFYSTRDTNSNVLE